MMITLKCVFKLNVQNILNTAQKMKKSLMENFIFYAVKIFELNIYSS